MGLLDELLARIEEQPEHSRAALKQEVMARTQSLRWIPNPGPQTDAYHCKADILFYGGSAGGGKSDLIVGLAFNEHEKSLIMRRQYTDLGALTDRACEVNGSRDGYNGGAPPKLRRGDQLLEFGAAKDVGDEDHFRGRAHDFLGIDEAAQFVESQIRFLMGWLRTTKEGQRTRVVLASNPPLADEGLWLVRMFAPWLDPTHPHPARPGELRWYITDEDGEDREVEGQGPHDIGGREVMAMSRTFIPAKVDDNPYLANTTYARQLDALPEPLRSALRDGDFRLGRRDHDLQLIPTDWIREAQQRWTPKPPDGVPMCAIGLDVAQGGEDNTVLAPRHDGWYAPLIAIPGKKTPFGADVAGYVIRHRRDEATVVIDMGGGYGGASYEHLQENGVEVKAYKGAESSTARTKDRKLGFHNKRAEIHWKFREALDPSQPGGSPIALPPDPELVSDLASIRLAGMDIKGIQLEPKKALVKRIGRSPDRGDAVVMAWSEGNKAMTHASMWRSGEMGGRKRRPQVILGHQAARSAARR